MIVDAAPSVLVTVIALPRKFMLSKYVPGETRTVSPLFADEIAPWIVETSAGTLMVVWAEAAAVTAVNKSNRRQKQRHEFIADFGGKVSSNVGSIVVTCAGDCRRKSSGKGLKLRHGSYIGNAGWITALES